MTEFMNKSFSSRPATKAYRDNFDKVFKPAAPDCKLCDDTGVYRALKMDGIVEVECECVEPAKCGADETRRG